MLERATQERSRHTAGVPALLAPCSTSEINDEDKTNAESGEAAGERPVRVSSHTRARVLDHSLLATILEDTQPIQTPDTVA